MLHVIIPTYQAETDLPGLLDQLSRHRIIISDGGSKDRTLNIAARFGASIALGAAGRGQQLKLGARLATLSGGAGDWFLFLHADCRLPDGWDGVIEAAMRDGDPRYFRFKADATGFKAILMNALVALRCWALGLPYGDQGVLISRSLYEQIGGYAPIALFEDVDLVERLRAVSRLRPLPIALRTDVSAHWREGLWKRGLRNLGLLWRYKRGASVESLLKAYQR